MTNSPPALVTVQGGVLRGHRSGAGAVFLGIPYGAPPTGALRWRPPQPVQPWRATRDALAYGPHPLQPDNSLLRPGPMSEDCLYLNVWTPTLDPGARLPVLVWVHGGGFHSGSGAEMHSEGTALAAQGAVVVTFSYRVGVFGFLAHPALSRENEHGVSGNWGLRDQLAALHWVRDNIAAFGGDPDRVTAFGVSAGSASISLWLTSPHSRGLFRQAILHSPGAGRPLASLADAEQAGLVLGKDIEVLRSASAAETLAKNALLIPKVRSLTKPRVLRPIRDGWLLPDDERTMLQAGRQQAMPLIVGTNADEGTSLTQPWPIDSVAAWRAQVEANFGPAAAEAAAHYPARHDTEARPAVAAMFADTQFNYGARLLARAMAKVQPRTYKYLFTRRRPGAVGGPQHGEEVPYPFGNVERTGRFDAVDQELSRVMRQAWYTFARDGDPGLAGWEPYRVAEDNHLAFGDRLETGRGWRGPQLDFLERFHGT